jgi:hypothetical protein
MKFRGETNEAKAIELRPPQDKDFTGRDLLLVLSSPLS